MKSLNKHLCLAGLSLCCGCASENLVQTLRHIPDYPDTSIPYRTTATCAVAPMAGLEQHALQIEEELRYFDYEVYTKQHFLKASPTLPDFIIEVLRWNVTQDEYLHGLALYGQLIVRVRRPGVLSEDKTLSSFLEKPRDFQVVGRSIISDRKKITSKDIEALSQVTIRNLMRNPSFREALQAPLPETPSDTYGLPLTSTPRPVEQTPPQSPQPQTQEAQDPQPQKPQPQEAQPSKDASEPSATETTIVAATPVATPHPQAQKLQGKWVAKNVTISKSHVPSMQLTTGVETFENEHVSVFGTDGSLLQNAILNGKESAKALSYTYSDDVLTTISGETKIDYSVIWYGEDKFELRILDIAAHEKSLAVAPVRRATFTYNTEGIATTHLYLDNVEILISEMPLIYTRVKE